MMRTWHPARFCRRPSEGPSQVKRRREKSREGHGAGKISHQPTVKATASKKLVRWVRQRLRIRDTQGSQEGSTLNHPNSCIPLKYGFIFHSIKLLLKLYFNEVTLITYKYIVWNMYVSVKYTLNNLKKIVKQTFEPLSSISIQIS